MILISSSKQDTLNVNKATLKPSSSSSDKNSKLTKSKNYDSLLSYFFSLTPVNSSKLEINESFNEHDFNLEKKLDKIIEKYLNDKKSKKNRSIKNDINLMRNEYDYAKSRSKINEKPKKLNHIYNKNNIRSSKTLMNIDTQNIYKKYDLIRNDSINKNKNTPNSKKLTSNNTNKKNSRLSS
jgi:hypothetical protein